MKGDSLGCAPAVWTALTLWRGTWTSGGVRLGITEDRDVEEAAGGVSAAAGGDPLCPPNSGGLNPLVPGQGTRLFRDIRN